MQPLTVVVHVHAEAFSYKQGPEDGELEMKVSVHSPVLGFPLGQHCKNTGLK